jgi:hypothetical protein
MIHPPSSTNSYPSISNADNFAVFAIALFIADDIFDDDIFDDDIFDANNNN